MQEFKKLVKTKKLFFTMLIILTLLTIFVFIYINIYINNQKAVYLDKVDDEYTLANVNVYLLTDYFATLNDSGDIERFYIVFDENENIFVVRLDDETFDELSSIHEYTYNAEIDKANSELITGRTKLLPSEIKNYALDYLISMNLENSNIDENIIYYLDTTITNTYILHKVLYIFIPIFLLELVIIILWIVKYIKRKKKINLITEEELKDFNNYANCHVIVTNNYVVNYKPRLLVIKIDDIKWLYPYEVRNNKKVCERNTFIMTNNNKYNIGSISKIDEEKESEYGKLYQDLVNKAKDALKGYTKENKNKVKDGLK